MPLDSTMLAPDSGANPAFDPSTATLTSPPPGAVFDPSTAKLTSAPAFDPNSAKSTGELDPVVGKSLEELGKSSDFNATKYALEHPDFLKQTFKDTDNKIITGMDYLAKVNDLQERKPWEAPSIGGTSDFLGRVWTQGKGLVGSAIDAQNKINRMRSGLLTPGQGVTFANEAVAGVESGFMQAVDFAKLIYGGLAKVPISVAHKLEAAFGLEPSAASLEELAKQKFQAKVAEAQQMGEVARGQGEFTKSEPGRALGLAAAASVNPVTMAQALAPVTPSPGGEEPGKTALTLPSISADDLAKAGLEKPNPSVIAGISIPANPLNYIPVGAASGALSKELATLVRGTGILDTAVGARAAQLFEAGAGKVSQVAEKALPTNLAGGAANLAGGAISGTGKALGAGFGKSVGLLAGAGALLGQAAGHAVTGGLGGAAAAAGLALTGAAATRVGEFLLRTGTKLKQGEGFLFNVLDAVANKPVTGAARGVLATLPLAALVDDKDAQASIVASGAVIGGATGATLGLVEKGFQAGEATGGHAAGQVFGPLKGPEVYSPGYGDAPLDGAHAAAMSTATPLVRSVVSRVREAFRNMPVEGGAGGRVEAYLLEPNQFKSITGQDGAGFTQSEHIAPDGTRIYRIFLNKGGGAGRSVFHEAAHALQIYVEQFHPDLAAKVHEAIQSIPEERRQAFGDFYDLSRQLDNPGQEITPLTPELRDQEIFAEMAGAALQGHPLDASLSPLAKPVWQAVGSALEDLGLYNPGMKGTPVPKGAETPMGMSPSFKVAGAVNKVMSEADLGAQNKGPLESPQIFESTRVPKGKPYTPPKPPKVAPAPEAPVSGPTMAPTEDPSWGAVVAKVDTLGLTPEQQARVREVTANRQGPLLIDYEGVPTPRPGTREAVRSDQEMLYIREALGSMDPEDRAVATQMAAPIRWIERPVEGGGTNLNLLTASMSKFLENAWLTVKAVVDKAPTRLGELVPYPVEGGKITPEGNHQLIQDEVLVSNNLAHGYDAQGNPIQRPASYQGVIPETDPNFTPQRLEGDNATAREQFLNLLQGIEPPKTPRVQPPRKNPQTGEMITRPANIEAADLAAANQRPLAPAQPVAGTKPPKSTTFPTGEEIQEVNPLRATYGELGIDLRNIVHEVPQELNIEHIKSVQPAESGMAARPTGLSTAGFMPKVGEMVEIEDANGIKRSYKWDGIHDWGTIGGKVFGPHPSLTAVNPIEGEIARGGTLSFGGKALKDRGYKVPEDWSSVESKPFQWVLPDRIEKAANVATDITAMQTDPGAYGFTINTDGTPWQVPDTKPDIVSLLSEVLPQADLTPARVSKFAERVEKFLNMTDTNIGVFRLSKPGKNGEVLVSIDANVEVDRKFRENTVKVAGENNQESIFDTAKMDTVPTGGDGTGNRITTVEEVIRAAEALKEGKPHTWPGQQSPGGSTVIGKPPGGAAMPMVRKTPPGVELSEDRPIPTSRKGYIAQEFWASPAGVTRAREGHLTSAEGILGHKSGSVGMTDLYNEMAEKGYFKTVMRDDGNVWVDSRPNVSGITSWNDVPASVKKGLTELADEHGSWIYFNGEEVYTPALPAGSYMPIAEAGATKETAAQAKKAWEEQGTDSPYFKKWSEGAPVLEEGYASDVKPGEPVVLRAFHGTTHKFDAFGNELGNPENSFGVGHYFTTDAADATRNYKGVGPDLTIRLEQRAETLQDEGNLTRNQALAKARKELVGKKPAVIDAYVKLKNPLVLEKNGGTRFSIDYDEATGQESGNGVDLYNSVLRVAAENGVDGAKLWQDISEPLLNYEEAPAAEIFNRIINNAELLDSNVQSGEFARQVAQDLGYDGIVDGMAPERWKNMEIRPGEKHVIVWDPTQIKSVENRGTFNPEDARFSFMPKLPHAAKEDFDVIHYSGTGGLKTIDPARFGKGRATPVDLRGGKKSYFFVKGSPLGQDTGFAKPGLNEYSATLSGAKIYDARKTDRLGWYDEINREKADQLVKDAGYDGIVVKTEDGRTVVAMFKPVPVEATGVTGKPGKRPLAGQFMAKLPGEYSDEFDLGPDLTTESLNARAARMKRRAAGNYPEALPLKPVRDAEGNVAINRQNEGPRFVKEPYDFERSSGWREAKKASKNGDPLPLIAKKAMPEIKAALKNPEVAAGLNWYENVYNLLKKHLGDDADTFGQMLAATSPRQGAIANFDQAFDLFNQLKSGAMDKKLERYGDLLEEWADPKYDWAAEAANYRRATGDSKPSVNRREVQNWLLDREGILPRLSTTGEQAGINSRAALDVMARRWMETNKGPKTSRFFQNLTGNTVEGTIDVWAARWLHRLLNEGYKERWRILPAAEGAVLDADYAPAMAAFQAVAKKAGFTTSQIQGLLWFWEKHTWEDRGWTRGAGREKASYAPLIERMEKTPQGTYKLKPEDISAAEPQKQLDLLK